MNNEQVAKIYLTSRQNIIISACLTTIALMTFGSSLAYSASLLVQVTDGSGHSIENAVVYAEPAPGEMMPKQPKSPHTVEIAQINLQFVPLVTVVQTGTEISFPNNDSVKHHVYSFSPAKNFDLPLYSGKTAKPQLFDKAGTVVLGCNIHDKMIAYVQVVDTPYFAKSNATGKAKIDGINPGNYVLKGWLFNLPSMEQVVTQNISVLEGDNHAMVNFTIKK